MRRLLERALSLAGVVALLAPIGGLMALGASPNTSYYLVGDSEPVGSLSTATPPNISLPNYDPGRDAEPGLLLKKGGAGVGETDPTKYQQWEETVAAGEYSVTNFVVWAAMKDFDTAKSGLLGVYLLDCTVSCVVLDSSTQLVQGKTNWSRVTVALSAQHSFDPGHTLAVKMVVLDSSDDDMWLAYGTATYDAHLLVQQLAESSTTTTTTPSTTTTTAPNSTTTTSTTTTTLPGTPTTSSTTTTSAPSPPTITLQPEPAPSTTQPGLTTSTTAAGGGNNGDQSTSTSLDPATDSAGSEDDGLVALPSGSDEDPPPPIPKPEDAQVIETAEEMEVIAADIPLASSALSPQQGLVVAFATGAQTFRAQLLPAMALGLLGAVLLVVGLSRRDPDWDEPGQELDSSPGSWWFSG